MIWLLIPYALAGLPVRADFHQCGRADHLAGAGDAGWRASCCCSQGMSEIIKKIAVMRG
jgi:hypothetical protein